MESLKKRLILFLTMKCNLECAHCAVDSSPRRNELMTFDEAAGYIDQAHELGFTSIVFTGGECFLYPDLLFTLIERAAKYSMTVSCVTNCFWGKTKESTRSTIETLKSIGLSYLDVSVDKFHEEFIDYAVLENVIRECNQQKLPIIIKTVGTAVDFVTDKINHSIDAHELDRNIITIEEILCLPMGAAARNLKEADFFRFPTDMITDSLCPKTEDFIIIPSGDAYPCCSPGGFTRPLNMGSVKEKGLSHILKNYPTGELAVMEIYGPVNVAKAAIAMGAKYQLKTGYTGFCEVCHDMLNRSDMAEYSTQLSQISEKEFYNLRDQGEAMIQNQQNKQKSLDDLYNDLAQMGHNPVSEEILKLGSEIKRLEEDLKSFKDLKN